MKFRRSSLIIMLSFVLVLPALAQQPPIPYELQRARMDEAYKMQQGPSYRYKLQVPHLDPVLLSNELIDGTLTDNKNFAFVIAHRGYHSEPGAGEHTPTSIMAAYLAGSDAIELDTKRSKDDYIVLGHDFTMARETSKWAGSTVPQLDILDNFPRYDQFYVNLSQANSWPKQENSPNSSPANPKRNQMLAKDMWDASALDNYNNYSTGDSSAYTSYGVDHQMTLYESLYFVAKYAPMQIWLDIKGWNDVQSSAETLAQLRSDLSKSSDPRDAKALRILHDVFVKLSYGKVVAKYEDGLPASMSDLLHVTGMHYFLVFGASDISALSELGDGDPLVGYRKFCQPKLGCVGNEFGYKYPSPGSAVDAFQKSLVATGDLMASFHNSPPYLWYWWAQQDPLDVASTWGRWYIRADGTCCANRYDVLGYIPEEKGPEIDDLRPSATFEENGYQAITTDNTVEVLRDLERNGRRPADVMARLQSEGPKGLRTGGENLTDAVPADGVYVISTTVAGEKYYLEAFKNPLPEQNGMIYLRKDDGTHLSNLHTESDLWFVKKRDAKTVTIQAAINGRNYLGITDSGGGILTAAARTVALVTDPNHEDQAITLVKGFGDSLGIQAQFGVVYDRLLATATLPAKVYWINAGGGENWTFTQIKTPFPEKSNNSVGPSGLRYCAEAGGQCETRAFNATVAYGNAKDYLIREVAQLIPCSDGAFGTGATIGSIPGCFYSPSAAGKMLPRRGFPPCALEGQTCQVGDGPVAYGNPTTHRLVYVNMPAHKAVPCNAQSFGVDPAYNQVKQCFAYSGASQGPPGFTLCAEEGDVCDFKGTAAIAFGVPGSETFLYRTFVNAVKCTVTAFVADPAPGKPKACFYLDASKPQLNDYAFIASESTTMTLKGPGTYYLLYGAEDSTVGKVVSISEGTKSVPCSNAEFGRDPKPGVSKACYQVFNSNAVQLQPCAFEGQPCSAPTGSRIFAYGSFQTGTNGSYTNTDYKLAGASVPCATSKDGFVRDPILNVHKACWQAPLGLPQQAPPHFTYCAKEGGVCLMDGIKAKVAYGVDGSFVYQWGLLGSFSCDSTAFDGNDPAPGKIKGCYVYLYD